MSSPEWREVSIAELGDVVTGRTPPAEHPEFFGNEIPFLTPTDMTGVRVAERPARFLSREGADALRRIVVPFGVAVSCIGWQMGKSLLVTGPAATNQQINTIVPRPDIVDFRFLYYAMLAKRDEIFRLGAGGSRTPILNKSEFQRLKVQAPPLTEQQAIAHILGTLDDKIELNRRMNETLEAIARAIFKSWFVDFLPVRAKMAARTQTGDAVRAKAEGRLPAPRPNTFYVYVIECDNGTHYIGQTDDLQRRWEDHKAGKVEWTKRHKPVKVAHYEEFSTRQEAVRRESDLKTGFGRKWLKKLIASGRTRQAGQPSGMDAETAALFPDSFEDSALGKIPKGWRLTILAEVLRELVSGSRPKGGAVEAGVPSIGAENIIGLGQYDHSKDKFIPHDYFEQLKRRGAEVRHCDVLLYKDGAQIGRKAFFDCDFPYAECAVNEHVLILRAKNGWNQRFLYFWLDQQWMTDGIIALNSNSAQPGINQAGVRQLSLLRPPDAVIQRFDSLVKPFTDRVFFNCHQTRTLAAIRDALLPKLVSGEIRVVPSQLVETAKP